MKDNLFSYYTNGITETKPKDNNMTIDRLAKGIKTQFKTSTESLRLHLQQGDKEQADKIKRGLDYVTFSGIFSKRGAKNIVTYSELLAIDLDDLPDVVEAKKTILEQTDIDIAMMFVSPSGNGLKVVVPSTTEAEHLQVFRMYQRYFKSIGFDVDESGKDIGRACFVCHDPDVYHSDTFEFKKLPDYWDEPTEATRPQPQTHTTYLHNTGTNTGGGGYEADDLDEVIKVAKQIKAKGLNIAPDYNSYLDVGFALATLGEAGRSVYHSVCSVSEKYNYEDTDRKFTECLNSGNGSIGLGTFFQLAKDVGIKLAKRATPTIKRDTTLSNDIEKGVFDYYFFDEKNNITISPTRLMQWLMMKGFKRISEAGDDNIKIIKGETKAIEPFNYLTDTIAYLRANINPKDKEREQEISDYLLSKTAMINKVWLLMEAEPYDLQRDNKNTTYIPFKNGVAKITGEGIEMLDYSNDEVKLFMKVESMNHNFINTLDSVDKFDNREAGDFERFVNYAITGSDKDASEYTPTELGNVSAFYTMIGYLMSNYKAMGNAKAIILSDEGADGENRKGGRGKTLISKAIQMFRMNIFKGGAEFDPTYRHNFADLQRWHDVYVIDDVNAGFRYDLMYTNITGDITAERKGTTAVGIPFKDAPKFVITTNWAVRYSSEASSTNRRFNEYKFSDYWNDKRQPKDVFDKYFWDEWEATDWQSFFEFMAFCCVLYLRAGLQKVVYNKDADNYRAYFFNDAIELEAQRIFEKLGDWQDFSVTDFMEVHQQKYSYSNDRLFNVRTARNYIDAYISYHKLGFEYGRGKKWRKAGNVFDGIAVPATDGILPF